MMLLLLGALGLGAALASEPAPPQTSAGDLSADQRMLKRQLDTLSELIVGVLSKRPDPDAVAEEPLLGAVARLDEGLRALAMSADADGGAPPDLADTLGRLRRTLLTVRTLQVDRNVRLAQREQALERGQQLLDTLRLIAPIAPADAEVDRAHLTLVRVADTLGASLVSQRWAGACVEICGTPDARQQAERVWRGEGLDPLGGGGGQGEPMPADGAPVDEAQDEESGLLRWRLGVSWTVPSTSIDSDGNAVRKSVLGGEIRAGFAPTPPLCIDLSVARDAWRVQDAPDLGRTRVEGGWCPSLLVARRSGLTAALRIRLGIGMAYTGQRIDGARDVVSLQAGFHGRAEVPVRIGPVELTPSVGLAPYGGAGQRYVNTPIVGLGVAVGGGRSGE